MNKKQKLCIGFCVLLLTAFITTGCFQDVLTPAWIDASAIAYAQEKVPSILPWTTLWDAERVAVGLEQQHFLNQRELARLQEDDTTTYDFLSASHSYNIASAKELRDNVFSPTSPIGALIPALGGLGLGYIGLSRPADKKKLKELEILKANDKS